MSTASHRLRFLCVFVLVMRAIAGADQPEQSNAFDRSKRQAVVYSRESRIAIFIGPQTRDGFVDVDKGLLDSIQDIKKAIAGIKRLRIVTRADEARLVLEVISRGATSTSAAGSLGIPIDTSTFDVPFGSIGIAT